MKNPFTNLLKKKEVTQKSVTKTELAKNEIDKPIEQVKEERKEIKIPEPKRRAKHPAPRFESQVLSELRKKRAVRNRIQKESRKVNFSKAH